MEVDPRSGLTASEQVVSYLQATYGSADYANLQTLRGEFYSFVTYPLAGAAVLNFFGDSIGSNNTNGQFTNLPKQNSFGQVHFLLKSIYFDFYIADPGLNTWGTTGLDASTLVSDMIAGFFQTGAFSLNIQSRNFIQLPLPFQYLAKHGGQPRILSAGLRNLTLAAATPDTFATNTSCQPTANLAHVSKGMYQVSPNILIEAEQNFDCNITWGNGASPVIATGIVTTNNPLKVGIIFDGIIFRPMQ